jgi:hypothetical protein
MAYSVCFSLQVHRYLYVVLMWSTKAVALYCWSCTPMKTLKWRYLGVVHGAPEIIELSPTFNVTEPRVGNVHEACQPGHAGPVEIAGGNA